MKERSRTRRVLKWLGLGLNLLLIAAFFVSLKFSVGVSYGGCSGAAGYGCIFLTAGGNPAPFMYRTRDLVRPEMWTKQPVFSTRWNRYSLIMPIWIPLLAAAIVTVWLWRSDRKFKSGCVECGYDLTGNISGVCPECGMAIEPEVQVP